MNHRLLEVGMLLCVMAGCGGPPDGSADAADVAATLDGAALAARAVLDRTGAMREVAGGLSLGDATSTFRAYYEGGALRAIEEELDQGDLGRAEATYVFVDGRLAWYASRGTLTATGPARAGAVDTLAWRAAFDGDTVVAIEKRVNGGPVPPDDWKAGEIVRHVAELARAAQALGGG